MTAGVSEVPLIMTREEIRKRVEEELPPAYEWLFMGKALISFLTELQESGFRETTHKQSKDGIEEAEISLQDVGENGFLDSMLESLRLHILTPTWKCNVSKARESIRRIVRHASRQDRQVGKRTRSTLRRYVSTLVSWVEEVLDPDRNEHMYFVKPKTKRFTWHECMVIFEHAMYPTKPVRQQMLEVLYRQRPRYVPWYIVSEQINRPKMAESTIRRNMNKFPYEFPSGLFDFRKSLGRRILLHRSGT
jgi:hypothetical protein